MPDDAIALDRFQALLFSGRQNGEQITLLAAADHDSIMYINI